VEREEKEDFEVKQELDDRMMNRERRRSTYWTKDSSRKQNKITIGKKETS